MSTVGSSQNPLTVQKSSSTEPLRVEGQANHPGILVRSDLRSSNNPGGYICLPTAWFSIELDTIGVAGL